MSHPLLILARPLRVTTLRKRVSLSAKSALLLMALVLLSAAACAGPVSPDPTATLNGVLAEPTAQPATPTQLSPTVLPTTSPTPTPQPAQKTHYTLDAVLDYDLHQLQVSEKIHYIFFPYPGTIPLRQIKVSNIK